MRLVDGQDFLELEVAERLGNETPTPGDTRFSFRVQMTAGGARYFAETSCWIALSALVAFVEQLRRVDERREGAAILESMSPGELRLQIRGTDHAGHMEACGEVALWLHRGTDRPSRSSISFAIPFCPSELPSLVREFGSLADAS